MKNLYEVCKTIAKKSAFLLFIEICSWIVLIVNSGWLLFLYLQSILNFLSFSCVYLLSIPHWRSPCCLNFSHEKRALKSCDGTVSEKDTMVASDFLFASFLRFPSTSEYKKTMMIRSLLGTNSWKLLTQAQKVMLTKKLRLLTVSFHLTALKI